MNYFNLFTLSILLVSCVPTNERTLPNPKKLIKNDSPTEQGAPKTLKATKWNSEFYHYHNFYHFLTDSTGYFEEGQVAWSCPIDLKANKIDEDEILYQDKQDFSYSIKDRKLKLVYKDTEGKTTDRTFTFRSEHKDFISEYEYAYGKEVIQPGERAEHFNTVPMISK